LLFYVVVNFVKPLFALERQFDFCWQQLEWVICLHLLILLT